MTETERQTAGRIAAFLDAHHVMSLATNGREGSHAVNVFYVRDGAALLWVSDPESRHSLDIENNPSVAATVASDCADIAEIQGVQISGHARLIRSASGRDAAQSLLERRYPAMRRLAQDATFRRACARTQFYRLEPSHMVLIDNTRGFAHKDMLDLEQFSAGSLRDLFDSAKARRAS
jgi:uncharacterized protein YhbP (UPF0306 family)